MISYIYIRFGESGVRGKLMPGHHQDVEYSPNPIYIYIRNRTVRTPPHHQRFSKINEIFISINLCRGTIKMLNTHQILYIYIRNRTVRTPPKRLKFYSKFYSKFVPKAGKFNALILF